jgi:NAD+ synthase
LHNYCSINNIKALVIGVSGGIDSAVSSTLAASTGIPTYAIGMPINQIEDQKDLSEAHLNWLDEKFDNVTILRFDHSDTFETFKGVMGEKYGSDKMALANTRSRIRMVTLYQVSATVGGIVVGTGNKVEDYGVGFYTKYGDGGVDIAPIADLYKTEVWELGKFFGIDERIIEAQPTDGLWDDGRTDEDQLGASYFDLEYAMEHGTGSAVGILHEFNCKNKHKMNPIPTFKV